MTKKSSWEVYIIQAQSGKLYTGITTDFDRRFAEHANDASKGAKFFRISAPDKVLYRQKCPNRSAASKREAEIKKMTRAEKLILIKNAKFLAQKIPHRNTNRN